MRTEKFETLEVDAPSNNPCFDYQIELVRRVVDYLAQALMDFDPNNPDEATIIAGYEADLKTALLMVYAYDYQPELFPHAALEGILEYADGQLESPNSMDAMESRCPTMVTMQ